VAASLWREFVARVCGSGLSISEFVDQRVCGSASFRSATVRCEPPDTSCTARHLLHRPTHVIRQISTTFINHNYSSRTRLTHSVSDWTFTFMGGLCVVAIGLFLVDYHKRTAWRQKRVHNERYRLWVELSAAVESPCLPKQALNALPIVAYYSLPLHLQKITFESKSTSIPACCDAACVESVRKNAPQAKNPRRGRAGMRRPIPQHENQCVRRTAQGVA
jgi:hypothetical protein